MKRRTWLSAASSTLAVAACNTHQLFPSQVAGATQGNEVGWIDAHAHVWPRMNSDFPLSEGFTAKDVIPESFTPEELLQQARPSFVQRVVLIQMSFFGFDNRYMLDCIKRYPKYFRGVGIVNHDASGLRETMTNLRKEGVRGYRLYANAKNVSQWASSSGVNELFRICTETNQAACLLSDPDALPGIEAMVAKYPDTTVVIDHFSRIGMTGTVNRKDLDALLKLSKYKNTYVKTSAFYALGEKKAPYKDLLPMIRSLRDSFGANRLMWASDCPYQVQAPHTYADSIALVLEHADFLSEGEKKALLAQTAERVFFQD